METKDEKTIAAISPTLELRRVGRKYRNKEPITSVLGVLKLLANPGPGHGRWMDAVLKDGLYDGGQPYVEVIFDGREYEGNSYAYYSVDPACFATVKDSRWVDGTPKWGRTDYSELHITDEGYRRLRELTDEEIRNLRAVLEASSMATYKSGVFNFRNYDYFRLGDPAELVYGYVFGNLCGEYFLISLDGKTIARIPSEKIEKG